MNRPRTAPLLAALPALTAAALLAAAPAVAAPATGTSAPTFGLYAINADVALDVAGNSVINLEDFAGIQPVAASRTVLLAFFDTSAPGAAAELQALAKLQKRLGGALQVLAVCQDRDLAEISRLAKDRSLPYPVLRDRFRVVSDRYGAPRGTVEYVLVDREATVVSTWTGSVVEKEGLITARAAQ